MLQRELVCGGPYSSVASLYAPHLRGCIVRARGELPAVTYVSQSTTERAHAVHRFGVALCVRPSIDADDRRVDGGVRQ